MNNTHSDSKISGSTRTICKICSKLTIKTLKWCSFLCPLKTSEKPEVYDICWGYRKRRRFSTFIVKFERNLHISVSIIDFKQINVDWESPTYWKNSLGKKYLNTKFFLVCNFPYSVRIWENTFQKKISISTLFTQWLII